MSRIDSLDDILKNADIARLNPELVSQPQTKRAKYGNKRTESNGQIFDSGHEAEIEGGYALLKRAGAVVFYFCQVPFEVAPGVIYVSDFVVCWAVDWHIEVVDAKSEPTRKDKVYRLKKKLFETKFYPMKITEV